MRYRRAGRTRWRETSPAGRDQPAGQVYDQLRQAIGGGRLLPGDRLTPTRQLAAERGISRHTGATARAAG